MARQWWLKPYTTQNGSRELAIGIVSINITRWWVLLKFAFSQFNDIYIIFFNEFLFTGNTPGDSKNQFFFIEAGALDGETLSNTLYLELKYNWTGLLVAPNPWLVSFLSKKKRNAWISPHCLSPTKAPIVVKFDAMGEYGGIINNEHRETKMPGNINSNNTRGCLGPMWRRTIEVNII